MSERIDPDRQQLLADLLAGDRHMGDPEIDTYLAKDPSLRAEFEELSALEARIGAVGQRERELLAAADAVEDGRAFVPEFDGSTRVDAGRFRRPARPWFWFALGLAAAAAVVVVGYLLRPEPPARDRRDDERVLSGKAMVLHEDLKADGSRRFYWETTMRGAKFEAMVYDPAVFDPATGDGEPLAQCEGVLENPTEWVLEPGLAAQVRTGFRLRVVAFVGGREKPFELPLK